MTDINEALRLTQSIDAPSSSRRATLIGVGALLVILTNAVVFVLPPLLKASFVPAASLCILLFAAVNAAFLLLLGTYSQVPPEALAPADAYGLGITALQTGLIMLPFAVTFVVGSVAVDGPIPRGRGGSVLIVGAVVSAAGLAWLAVAHDQQWHYLLGAAVMGLGCSIGYAAGFTLVQLAVPEEKAGMAAGLAGTAMAIGFAFGTALVTGVLSATVVLIPGTTIEVATENLYGVGYWIAALFAALVVPTVLVAQAHTARHLAAARASKREPRA